MSRQPFPFCHYKITFKPNKQQSKKAFHKIDFKKIIKSIKKKLKSFKGIAPWGSGHNNLTPLFTIH